MKVIHKCKTLASIVLEGNHIRSISPLLKILPEVGLSSINLARNQLQENSAEKIISFLSLRKDCDNRLKSKDEFFEGNAKTINEWNQLLPPIGIKTFIFDDGKPNGCPGPNPALVSDPDVQSKIDSLLKRIPEKSGN